MRPGRRGAVGDRICHHTEHWDDRVGHASPIVAMVIVALDAETRAPERAAAAGARAIHQRVGRVRLLSRNHRVKALTGEGRERHLPHRGANVCVS